MSVYTHAEREREGLTCEEYGRERMGKKSGLRLLKKEGEFHGVSWTDDS